MEAYLTLNFEIKFCAIFMNKIGSKEKSKTFYICFQAAVDQLVSPLSNDRYISQWQQELLISSLIMQDMPHLALRALRAPGPKVSPHLEIKTLLANNQVTEAFELQRAKRDEELLLEFYKGCHEQRKWSLVLGLALTEKEGEILGKFLRTTDSFLNENLQCIYLLQRNRYIEALNYLENSQYKDRQQTNQQRNRNKSQNLIFSAFKLVMAPSEKEYCDNYQSIKGNVESVSDDVSVEAHALKTPKPLSTEMSKDFLGNKLNVFGGIFHQAVVSSKEATSHWLHPSISNDVGKGYVPFLTKAQIDFDYIENNNYCPVTCATPFIGTSKRRKDVSFDGDDEPEFEQPVAKRKRTDTFSITGPVKQPIGINKNLLTSFKQRKILTPVKSRVDANAAKDLDLSEDDGDNGCVNLLSTPVVVSARNIDKGSPNRSERGRPQTPQSILKTRKTDAGSCSHSRRSVSPTLTVGSARRSVDFSEKTYQYTIPQRSYTSLDTSDDFPLTTIPESVDGNASDSNSNSNSSYSQRIKARPPIRPTGLDNSLVSTSADEFYSPDNSKYSEQNSKYSELEDALAAATSKHSSQEPQSDNITPKRTASRSRSRGSTPELENESNRITRSKSRQLSLLNANELDENLEDTAFTKADSSTPYRLAKPRMPLEGHKSPKKSLSRMVVENSAMKLISRRATADEKAEETLKATGKWVEGDSMTSVDSETSLRPKNDDNFLVDTSELSESVMNRYLKRNTSSCYSSDASSKVNSSENFLEDSSSFEIPALPVKKQTEQSPKNVERTPSGEGNQTHSFSEKEDENDTKSTLAIASATASMASDSEAMEVSAELLADDNNPAVQGSASGSAEQSSVQKTPEKESSVSMDTTARTEVPNTDGNIMKTTVSYSVTKETLNVYESFQPDAREISQNVSGLSRPTDNFLQDNSLVSDTFMKHYMEQFNTTTYSDQSTMYGQCPSNFLEDSSFGPAAQSAPSSETDGGQRDFIELKSSNSSSQDSSSQSSIQPQSEIEEKQEVRILLFFSSDKVINWMLMNFRTQLTFINHFILAFKTIEKS